MMTAVFAGRGGLDQLEWLKGCEEVAIASRATAPRQVWRTYA